MLSISKEKKLKLSSKPRQPLVPRKSSIQGKTEAQENWSRKKRANMIMRVNRENWKNTCQ